MLQKLSFFAFKTVFFIHSTIGNYMCWKASETSISNISVLQHFGAVLQWCFLHRFCKHLIFDWHTFYDIITQKKNKQISCVQTFGTIVAKFLHFFTILCQKYFQLTVMCMKYFIFVQKSEKWELQKFVIFPSLSHSNL